MRREDQEKTGEAGDGYTKLEMDTRGLILLFSQLLVGALKFP